MPLAWTQLWTLTEVYPDQILAGSMPCRWAEIGVDLFSFTPAHNLVHLFFCHLNLAFLKKKKKILMPYHSHLRLLPDNNTFLSPLFFCCWQITDCCVFPGLELSVSACVPAILTDNHSQTSYLLFSLYIPEVLSDLSSSFYNCIHILDLVIYYIVYKSMGIAKSENKQ